MASTVITADIVAKEALAILENELGWVKKLHRAYEDDFKQQVNGFKAGDTISIRRPEDGAVRSGRVASPSDVIEGKIPLTVDQQIGTDFQFTSADLALKVEDLSDRVIKPRMMNIINAIASDVITQMYRNIPSWVGTPGSLVDTFAKFSKGPLKLDNMAVPTNDRCAILSPDDHWGLLGSQTGLYIQDAARGAYREGSLGMLGGLDTYMTQVAPVHTTGARGGTPLVNGASQNVTYDSVKNVFTSSLIIDGASNSITGWAKAGDVFTIAGVYMVNPRTKATTAILQQFVVTADADSSGAGAVTLTVSPPIISAAGQPHRTVNAAPADNAALTFVGTAATDYRQNLMFQKNTMALAVVPLEMPQGAVGGSSRSYKGFSVRVQPYYDGTNDISNWRLDMLYGRKVINGQLGTRVSG